MGSLLAVGLPVLSFLLSLAALAILLLAFLKEPPTPGIDTTAQQQNQTGHTKIKETLGKTEKSEPLSPVNTPTKSMPPPTHRSSSSSKKTSIIT